MNQDERDYKYGKIGEKMLLPFPMLGQVRSYLAGFNKGKFGDKMAIPSKVEMQVKDFGLTKVKFKYSVYFKGNKVVDSQRTAESQFYLAKKELGSIPAVSIKQLGKTGHQVSGIIEKRIFGNLMMFYFMQWGDGGRKTLYDVFAELISK